MNEVERQYREDLQTLKTLHDLIHAARKYVARQEFDHMGDMDFEEFNEEQVYLCPWFIASDGPTFYESRVYKIKDSVVYSIDLDDFSKRTTKIYDIPESGILTLANQLMNP